jgi:hypothetical protein
VNNFIDEFVDREADVGRALEAVRHVLMNHRGLAGRWRRLSVAAHLWHAVVHIAMHLIGNRTEPHLAHAATRTLMALQLFREGR